MSLVLMSVAAPVAAQAPATVAAPLVAPYVKPAPPGELVDIGGRRLHIECKGNAKRPVVILEAGLSQFTAHSGLGKAQDLIAAFARVCIYDRAGLGWSDPVPGARTQQDMVEDLHKLLRAKKLNGPFVLAGHSMGGLLVRLYARRYPKDVAALVLMDATSESYNFAPGAAEARKGVIAQIDAA
jgi:pimeloyl-ACP methyl ester carboxylesterase